MKIGIAGSTNGITEEQGDAFVKLMTRYKHKYGDLSFHHGGCRGADESVQRLLLENRLARSVDIHPPSDKSLLWTLERADRSSDGGKIKLNRNKERPHLGRFYDIVDTSQLLVTFPREEKEVKDSDVWAAVRYAKTKKKNIITFFRDGRATKWPAVKAAGKGV
jgi:hypothetical protein